LLVGLGKARHVLDRNFHAQFKRLARAGVDDGDGAVVDGAESVAAG
jgi:hypothetical protein